MGSKDFKGCRNFILTSPNLSPPKRFPVFKGGWRASKDNEPLGGLGKKRLAREDLWEGYVKEREADWVNRNQHILQVAKHFCLDLLKF